MTTKQRKPAPLIGTRRMNDFSYESEVQVDEGMKMAFQRSARKKDCNAEEFWIFGLPLEDIDANCEACLFIKGTIMGQRKLIQQHSAGRGDGADESNEDQRSPELSTVPRPCWKAQLDLDKLLAERPHRLEWLVILFGLLLHHILQVQHECRMHKPNYRLSLVNA